MSAWVIAGVAEGHGYSAARHDVSDLGALTARHAAPWLAVSAVTGLLTAAFAVWSLGPALAGPDGRRPLGAWLVAVSLPALDNVGDALFRLDCRAADAGCKAAQATASWHGKTHAAVFVVALLPTLVAPFALASRMGRTGGWRSLARPARWYGGALIAGAAATAASHGTAVDGLTQRGLIVCAVGGVVVLAARVLWTSPPG